MKRIVVGTHAQCMSVVKQSERMGVEGYDYYEMHPTTYEELKEQIWPFKNEVGRNMCFNPETANKHFDKGNLYTLTLFRDDQHELFPALT